MSCFLLKPEKKMKRSLKSIIGLIYNICHFTQKEFHSYFCFNGKKKNPQRKTLCSPTTNRVLPIPEAVLGGSSPPCQSKRWPSGALDKPGRL